MSTPGWSYNIGTPSDPTIMEVSNAWLEVAPSGALIFHATSDDHTILVVAPGVWVDAWPNED